MSNILKSTKLDIALVKPYFKTICFTLLLPIVFAAINRSLLTGVSFAMCFIAMTTGYTFSITEKNSMDRLFGILPVRKSELVIGRYVFVLAMGLLSLIISLIAQPPYFSDHRTVPQFHLLQCGTYLQNHLCCQ
jgi:ABC-2 type transport system permease protein